MISRETVIYGITFGRIVHVITADDYVNNFNCNFLKTSQIQPSNLLFSVGTLYHYMTVKLFLKAEKHFCEKVFVGCVEIFKFDFLLLGMCIELAL